MNYRFLVNRLKNASYGELLFRAKGFTLNLKLRHFTRSRPVFHGLEDDKDKIRGLEMPDLDIAMPDPLSTDVLGRTPYTLNTDHRSITECETKWGTVFWSDIRYQNSSVDIRAVLEPSRLQHITTLLVYSQRTKDNNLSREALRLAKASLLSWLPENPFLFGPNYISALECALRIPVFFYCLKMLDALSERDFTQLLRTVYEHTWWVAHRLSLYSSLGNHTIAEAVGLVFGGAIYGGSSEGKVWLGKGIGLLEQELSHQILDDGGPAEQSFDYHRFVLDLYWLAVDFCERNELHDCGPWMHRLTRGEEFLASVAMAGRLPSIGDSDAGHAVASDVVPSRPVTETKMERVRTFPGAGYSIVRTTSNAVLVFDHGSLGMAPLYNHGHADALYWSSIKMEKRCWSILGPIGITGCLNGGRISRALALTIRNRRWAGPGGSRDRVLYGVNHTGQCCREPKSETVLLRSKG